VLLLATAAYLYHARWRDTGPLRMRGSLARVSDSVIAGDWDLYQQLKVRDGWLGWLAPSHIAAGQMRAAYVAEGDRIIRSYRESSDSDTTRFNWTRGRTVLEHAREISPSDTSIRGRLAVVKGYVDLNLAIAQSASRQQMKNSVRRAWADFDQAVVLLPDSPDPHLGLARLYVYSFDDLDTALEEWRKAEQKHYQLAPREIQQKATGYRIRAQKEALDPNTRAAAKEDLERAKELYTGIADYGDVAQCLQIVAQDERALNPPPMPAAASNASPPRMMAAKRPAPKSLRPTRRTQAWQSPKAGKRRKS